MQINLALKVYVSGLLQHHWITDVRQWHVENVLMFAKYAEFLF